MAYVPPRPPREAHPWAMHLDSLRGHVWERLVRGMHDRHAPERHPTLATVTAQGWPAARTVVLRTVDAQAASLGIYTDLNSAKVAELRAMPFAAVHSWNAAAHLQVRLEAEATVWTGADAVTDWGCVAEKSRTAYGGTPHAGHAIASARSYTKSADPAAFAVIRLRVMAMDVLHLGTEHRRARFDRADGWQGQWLVP